MKIHVDPELCMICGVPVETGTRYGCEPCAERGIETCFCWNCGRYHRANHERQENLKTETATEAVVRSHESTTPPGISSTPSGITWECTDWQEPYNDQALICKIMVRIPRGVILSMPNLQHLTNLMSLGLNETFRNVDNACRRMKTTFPVKHDGETKVGS